MSEKLTPEQYALRIAPEGCDGNHPKGGCLFERVCEVLWQATIAGRRETIEECAKVVESLAYVDFASNSVTEDAVQSIRALKDAP